MKIAAKASAVLAGWLVYQPTDDVCKKMGERLLRQVLSLKGPECVNGLHDVGDVAVQVNDGVIVDVIKIDDVFYDVHFWNRWRQGALRRYTIRRRSYGRAYGGFPFPFRENPIVAVDDIVERAIQKNARIDGEVLVWGPRRWDGYNYGGSCWLVALPNTAEAIEEFQSMPASLAKPQLCTEQIRCACANAGDCRSLVRL